MTLVDSVDSILMLYSYSGFPERSWVLFERTCASRSIGELVAGGREDAITESELVQGNTKELPQEPQVVTSNSSQPSLLPDRQCIGAAGPTLDVDADKRTETEKRVKMNVMSGLSIVLTLMSILVAFSISLITIMGLIGENCSICRAAAEAEDGDGLAGSWWRGWAKANENSEYIGAAIVGGFVVIVAGWYAFRWGIGKVKGKGR